MKGADLDFQFQSCPSSGRVNNDCVLSQEVCRRRLRRRSVDVCQEKNLNCAALVRVSTGVIRIHPSSARDLKGPRDRGSSFPVLYV